MDKREVLNIIEEIEKQKIKNKIGYWETVGTALLGTDELGEKWCQFVKLQVNNNWVIESLLDGTLQIISMIKLNIPYEVIAKTINQIPSGKTIIDGYLPSFIHPDILYEIQSIIDSKKL